ncbi:MAG: hypothetical protein HRU70_03880 [Phycisphaeraceae bacterium]|nr:MAG: hypothetical protein HRU70_03880 [Phycisphaeraceae bacterium]
MFSLTPRHGPAEDPGAKARREHSEWLTWALSSGNRFPRIPLRAVDRGGFDRLMATPHGKSLAVRWWGAALRRVVGPGDPSGSGWRRLWPARRGRPDGQ